MDQKGQILNEAIIAMGLMTIGILSIVSIFSNTFNDSRHIADQAQAIKLAAEGIEITRNILDGNAVRSTITGIPIPWNEGFNQDGFYELDFKSEILGNRMMSYERSNLQRLRRENINGIDFYSYVPQGIITNFRRVIEIDAISVNHIRTTVKVYWIARHDRTDTLSLSSDFYNWR